MTSDLVNGAALLGALGLASLGATRVGGPAALQEPPSLVEARPSGEAVTALIDARGARVPVGDYARVVSVNAVADQLLLHLIEPERVAAVTDHSRSRHPEGWRFGARPTVSQKEDIERVLSLKPDLVLVSRFADAARVSRLREAGVEVFDLGEMRGVETTREDIVTLGTLLGQPERAGRLLARFDRELAALEARVPPAEAQPEGIYLSVYGDTFFGGTVGTSYADMLRYGGVRDKAARAGFTGWPQYTPEQLLVLDPTLILTQEGMARTICAHAQLSLMAACRPDGRVIELPGAYHSDPGLGLIEAAAAVQARVHDPLEPHPHPHTERDHDRDP
ncbi:MAG: ABC transporter substrate-binding protein [Alphaproteobacteria bacterium]|nr:ABC transporter substrate-binding protein [Alphaproteobacteria bacterium]